jgi:hypothetical protein
MELRQLRYFKGVAELLNFSRAAEQLRVAQSALSRQIQALEHEVGTTLLHRDRSHVALTDAGKAFYASTCKLLLHLDIAVTEAQQIARGAIHYHAAEHNKPCTFKAREEGAWSERHPASSVSRGRALRRTVLNPVVIA